MILRKFYKKRIARPKTNKWKTLVEEEISKESITIYNVSVLKGVKKYVEDNGGSIMLVDRPKFPDSNFSRHEKRINLKIWINRIFTLLYDLRLLSKSSLTKITWKYTNSPIVGSAIKLKKNYMVNEDVKNRYIRVVNGYRQDVKKKSTKNSNSIYVFGSSLVYSSSCEDEQTLPSFLDSQINNPNFQTLNRGVSSADVMNSCFAILDTQISKGDIIILYGLNPLSEKEKSEIKNEVHFLDLANIFKRPHNYGNLFYDNAHLTSEGNKAVAKFIATEINTNNYKKKTGTSSFSDTQTAVFHKIERCRLKAALRYIDEEFPNYINSLKAKYKSGINGIAAMNCNPFTLGHKHLVSIASKKVDNLYIFVVEEDKSFFKFKQRFKMIKEGVKDIANVEVVAAGKYLVSSMTFPDYFNKEEHFNPAMNVTYDFEIFMYYIASALKLHTRFIGTEPFCKTTRTHHEIMKRMLPPKGISVIEIERLENEYGPISASKVRKLIKNKEFDKLELFLPKTTIDSLTKHKYLN